VTLGDLQERLGDDLAVAITEHRGGRDAGNMARALLEREGSTKLLVALTEGARMAVYYEQLLWGVQLRGFDGDGVAARGTQVEKCRTRDALERWVLDHRAGLAWVHPRFRWPSR